MESSFRSQAALSKASAQDLLRKRCIQGFDVTGLEAIFDSIPHFKGHTQEIVHMTRCVLGQGYKVCLGALDAARRSVTLRGAVAQRPANSFHSQRRV